ncbi:MAG: sn-glycerol-3-phosphate ABC transporter ATP-binding protein UgpC [Microthrixaceae bacterium]
MAEITLDHVYKVYADGTQAVRDLSLSIAEGEFMVLVGPSGCGKTTALRMVAGLEDISSGTVSIGGRVVNQDPPKARDVAMVFQNYALYPHLSVRDNIGFGLKLRKMDREEIKRRVDRAADTLGLDEYLDRKPKALSGGQRQRVAMGRAIVREPKAFLMDEPLSNLDAKLRVQMRAEVLRLQQSLEVTTLYVTHDQVEAMTMGDRVAVLKRGLLQQVDAPQVLYDHPDNLFVAGFIGSPAMNLLEARLELDDGPRVQVGSQVIEMDQKVIAERPSLRNYGGRTLVLGIRPEEMEDASLATDTPPGQRISVRTTLVEALGSELLVHAEIDAPPLHTEDTRELAEDVGTGLTKLQGKSEVVAKVSPRSRIRADADVELAIDITRVHFFDPDSGRAVTD